MRKWVFLFAAVALTLSCQQKQPATEKQAAQAVMDLQDSVAYLTELISADSANYLLYKQRAELLIRIGRLDPAMRDIMAALETNPDDPALYLLLGDVYFILGQTDNSLNAYKKAYSLDPEDSTPLLSLAEAYLVMQYYNDSRKYLEMAASVESDNPKTYYLKGILDMEAGDTVAALVNLKIAANLDTLFFDALMQTGSLLSAVDDTHAAYYFDRALQARPYDERAMFLSALAQQEKGDYNSALDRYGELLVMYPGNKHAHFNTGYLYLVELEDFELAAASFREAIAADPSFVSAVYNLGRCYEAQGMLDEARVQYRQALELETNYPLAIEGLNRLDRLQFPD